MRVFLQESADSLRHSKLKIKPVFELIGSGLCAGAICRLEDVAIIVSGQLRLYGISLAPDLFEPEPGYMLYSACHSKVII